MKRRILSLITCLAVMLTMMSISVTVRADADFSGSGTEADPYLIGTASDLTTLASLTNAPATASTYADKYYKLTADIDMTGVPYISISRAEDLAAKGAAFTGTLDGDGHIVSNITLAPQSQFANTYGLIGYLGSGGIVKNLGVNNIRLNEDSRDRLRCGGIVGMISGGTVQNCYVKTVYFKTTSTNATYVGGIIGYGVGGTSTITNCYATGASFGNVAYKNYIGGIIGAAGGQSQVTVSNCYTNYGAVKGNWNDSGTFTASNNYASSTIANATATNLNAGGSTAYKSDVHTVNSGYPLLVWEAGFLGAGTEANPYEIGTASDLTELSSLTNTAVGAKRNAGKYYQLTADIDMTGISYKPISWGTSLSDAQCASFTGTLDGDGHIIKNITIPITYAQDFGSAVGVIGILGANGTVKNLGVENMAVTAGGTSNPSYMCIGGIAGSLMANVSIDRCYVKGMTVTATTAGSPCFVGGLSGTTISDGSTFTNCYTTGLSFTVPNDPNHKAGILGACGNSNCSATNCYTTDSKTQGYRRTGSSYLGTSNHCYDSSTIADATVANLGAAFKDDVYGKNGNKPLLAWEIDLAGTLSLSQSGETLTANANVVNRTGASQSVFVIICQYDSTDSYMVGCNLKEVPVANGASVTDAINMAAGEGCVYRAFLWESGRLIPLTDMEELN